MLYLHNSSWGHADQGGLAAKTQWARFTTSRYRETIENRERKKKRKTRTPGNENNEPLTKINAVIVSIRPCFLSKKYSSNGTTPQNGVRFGKV